MIEREVPEAPGCAYCDDQEVDEYLFQGFTQWLCWKCAGKTGRRFA